MSLADLIRRDRRRDILAFLDDCAEYTSNGENILSVLNGIGMKTTRDQLIGELAWLVEQGFVVVEESSGFSVVSATQRGVEVARGIARHPEVSRPRPRY
jgi:hypothetical protein